MEKQNKMMIEIIGSYLEIRAHNLSQRNIQSILT